MTTPAPSSLHLRLAVIALALLTLAVHGVDVTHEFVTWDDQLLLTKNELLNPVTAEHLQRFWSAPVQGLYAPLSYTLWAVATSVGRVSTPDANDVTLNPMVFHALNVLLHTGCALLVFAIVWQLAGKVLPAAIGAAFFAVHPLTVEPVAWVSGMNNLLAGLLGLAAIAAYVRWARGGRWRWYALAVAMCVSACLAKPTAIVTPLVCFAIDVLILRRSPRLIAFGIAPLLLATVPFVFIGRTAQEAADVFRPTLPQRLIIVGDTLGFYLRKLVIPWPLHMDYARTPESVIAGGGSAVHWAALAVVVIAVLGTARRWPWIAGSFAAFVAGMCLTLGLVPFDFQTYSTVADRYAYLALLGPAMLIAIGLARLPIAVSTLSVVVLLVLSVLAVRQSLTWRSTETMIAHQLKHDPNTLAVHTILAGMARRSEDFAAAERHYRASLVLRPKLADTNRALADVLRESGRPVEALPHYRAAYDLGDRKPLLFNNWGLALFALKRNSEAAEAFRAAVATDPKLVNGHINLALVLANLGKWDESEAHFRAALQLKPDSPEAQSGLAKVRQVRPK